VIFRDIVFINERLIRWTCLFGLHAWLEIEPAYLIDRQGDFVGFNVSNAEVAPETLYQILRDRVAGRIKVAND
jgi:hypothetical protein